MPRCNRYKVEYEMKNPNEFKESEGHYSLHRIVKDKQEDDKIVEHSYIIINHDKENLYIAVLNVPPKAAQTNMAKLYNNLEKKNFIMVQRTFDPFGYK